MLITGIKSKPVYTPLAPDVVGHTHLLVGFGVGGDPLLRLVGELAGSGSTRSSRQLYYVSDPDRRLASTSAIEAADAGVIKLYTDTQALLTDFRATLERSIMGTRLYVAGPEAFMGLVMRIAAEFNLNRDEIRAEECGSQARRVHCIHCRAQTENVRTNIVTCVGCQRWLVVRDHYSKRLAAYMGVNIDAEVPGELPPIQEVFV